MKPELLSRHWFPLAPSSELTGSRPLARCLLGQELALVRLGGEAVAFEDRCPHRQVRLSRGLAEDTTLTCGYHGWCFDRDGSLVAMAGGGSCPRVQARTFPCRESQGLVWVRLDASPGEPDPPGPTGFELPPDWSHQEGWRRFRADFPHAIENFLDACHTPFVHPFLLRSGGGQSMGYRQQVTPDGFTTEYLLDVPQNGLVTRLLAPRIDRNLASFRMPGLASIDYLEGERGLLRVSLFFVPHREGEVGVLARIGLPPSWLPAGLRQFLLRPFLEALFRQDAAILEAQYQALGRHGRGYCVGPNDLVLGHLQRLLRGEPPGPPKQGELHL